MGIRIKPSRNLTARSGIAIKKVGHAQSDVSAFLVNVRSAQTVAVYEGLPHPMFEGDIYLSELKRADVVRIETFSFYVEPLSVSPPEKSELTEIVLGDDAHIR